LEDRSLALFVANGVTGVRDMGGHTERLLSLRGAVESGAVVGPRIRTPGAILESPRWLQWMAEVDSAAGASGEWRRGRIGVADEQRAAVVVDSLRGLGVDFIKVRTVASPAVFFAIARAAREAGLPLAGHYPFGSDPFAVAESGLHTLEHGFYFVFFDATPQRRDSVFRRLAGGRVAVTPTSIADRWFRQTPDSVVFAILRDSTNTLLPLRRYASPVNLRDWMETMEAKKEEDPPLDGQEMRRGLLRDLRELRAAGVTILAGTDAPIVLTFPGYSLHDELVYLVREMGLSPAEALRTATSTAAASLGIADAGEIRAGNDADLVILSANPLQDIAAIRRVEAVVLRGRLFDRSRLDALLRQAEF
ncbi:MAG TPA: amidohydrolase family protein, partial [Longimicrobium sp.]|nr:amidohydrolase family protein [Longimicrobium sp.]